MLTDETKNRLREEEIFRDEVRRSLKSPPTRKEEWWSILNSSIVIWALSSIVVAGVALLYANWREGYDKRLKDQQLASTINIEVAFRLRRFSRDMDRYKQLVDQRLESNPDAAEGTLDAANWPRDALTALEKPSTTAYSQFSGRNLSSLLIELASVSDQDSRPRVESAYEAAEKLNDINGDITSQTKMKMVAAKIDEIQSIVDTNFGHWITQSSTNPS